MRLMEWCYVCNHERLRDHRPAAPTGGGEEIVLPLPAASQALPQAAAA
jgi:hypothetical protein